MIVVLLYRHQDCALRVVCNYTGWMKWGRARPMASVGNGVCSPGCAPTETECNLSNWLIFCRIFCGQISRMARNTYVSKCWRAREDKNKLKRRTQEQITRAMQACKQQEGRTTHQKHNQEFKQKQRPRTKWHNKFKHKTREQHARTTMNKIQTPRTTSSDNIDKMV